MTISAVRKEGSRRLLWSGPLFLAIAVGTQRLQTIGWHHVPWELFIPGGFALAGAVQLVTGIPFSRLSAQRDSLAGWQRGVLGVAILIAASAVIFAAAAAYIIYVAG